MANTEVPIPLTIILDFHDSYSHNIKHLFHQVVRQAAAGQLPVRWSAEGWEDRVVVINVDSLDWDTFAHSLLPHCGCIVLGPGPGSPHRTADFSWPSRLIQTYGHAVPILGLCLGHQGLATAFGGSVGRAVRPIHGQVTSVRHTGEGLFEGVPAGFGVVQYNSLTVREEGLEEAGLEVVAWGENGGREEVLALRHREKPLWGVQFHPESISSTHGARLLSNFLALAVARAAALGKVANPPTPLPEHVLALSTMRRPPPPPPLATSATSAPRPLWAQRTVELSGGEARTAQEVFEGLVRGRSPLGQVWLDSARPTPDAQSSHVFVPLATWSHSSATRSVTVRTPAASTTTILPPNRTFLDALSAAQSTLHSSTRIVGLSNGPEPIGFVGFLGYEMRHVTMPLSAPPEGSGHVHGEQADAEFAFAGAVLSVHHGTGRWTASALVRLDEAEAKENGGDDVLSPLGFGLSEAEYAAWLEEVRAWFAAPLTAERITPLTAADRAAVLGQLKPDLGAAEYQAAVEAARELLITGEAYELCLTTQFRAPLPPPLSASPSGDPYPLYLALRATNPAPYGAFFHLPRSDTAVLSSSPERFLSIDASGKAEMRPIKGTVRRSADPEEDERRRGALEADEKERAENLMIVDLCRHDLLGVCEVGSVEVEKLMMVESYETVHQLVTSIVGRPHPDVSPFQTVAAAFPPGSMTGAPKLRSLKLLDELEGHRPRGIYSGAFGYVAVDGTASFSVVIRTLVVRGGELTLGAGGAVTHLSEARKEWEEVLVKAEAVVGARLEVE